MDVQKASYSITVMAKVLGVTRAGYYAWKNRAAQRGQRAPVESMRPGLGMDHGSHLSAVRARLGLPVRRA